ncbi:MAG: hypothetical protein II752_01515 [Muribaculaceae bacterium]|nr:hypothetical protein [Muribaculaceae bacterium]
MSCIENDIPYPHVEPLFESIVAKYQSKSAVIDASKRTVTLFFDETADIANVEISSYTLTEGATIDSSLSKIDLSVPKEVVITLYYDYRWTISAQQTVERYFSFASQVGSTTIDVPGRRVVAYISSDQDITKVQLLLLLLLPA